MKKHFFIKLIPPRPTFAMDMTDAERQHMQDHIVYWQAPLEQGILIVNGLVFDPNGPFGMGVMSVDDESIMTELLDNDPALKTGGRYEILPMRATFKEA
jgi:hypothetical protein